ncbi:uncharacterized protein LOC119365027 isoform X3 [Triticum dicoccoides]|uniref:uncharacterized protein LOC119365027 isoform X3 n=1 Tax=Triticum dicoccoides TaxID=85692 RepID=UPI000E7965A9|nr:uncharacterized protein LOC119365027 isoform X3 [Triticum dicoccoides]
MGCFLACFGGGDGDRRRRKPRRRSPARLPPRPRPDHVALSGEASSLADVVVKQVSAPLPEARALAPPPPRPPLVVEVAEEVAAAASSGKEPRELSEQKTVTSPTPTVDAVEEVVTAASPGRELRQLSEHTESPGRSLLQEKVLTPPLSPVKCSPVAAAVASTPDMELREVSEEDSRSGGKKKVTFDMNVTTYENTSSPDQEEIPSELVKWMEDEEEEHMQKTVLFSENHRYGNCTDSDDDNGDEYGEDDNYGDDGDAEEDFVDCKIDLLDEEEIRTEENPEESQESLFSLPMSNYTQNDQDVSSPVPKSSVTPAQEESPLIQGNNHRDRSQYVRPVLNPVQNREQWKEVKAQAGPVKKLYKENVNSVPNVGATLTCKVANQMKMGPSNSSKGEVSVDASLSTWLVSSDNSTVDKAQSKSPRSVSSVCRQERPVLGALTVDDLKQSSATSSPRRSPSHNREEVPILGSVGSYWSSTKQGNEYCSSRSDSGTNGIPNSTSKYREDRRVNWHSTPFNVRLDKAMKKSSA